jgi:hypothetical protein
MVTPDVSRVERFNAERLHVDPSYSELIISRPSRWGLPEYVAVAQVAGPALLYLPGSQALRAPLRIGVFALSLSGILWCWRSAWLTRPHPALILLVVAALYMMIMLFHPATNTKMAGIAQILMHVAVAAPLFWAPHYFRGDYQRLLRVVTILWALNGASAVVGILQVRDPDTWMPKEFTSALNMYKQKINQYQYKAADGKSAIRPPGLGDTPGAASGAGMFIALVGIAYMGLPVSPMRKLLGFVMGMAGIVVIFLTHVRSAIVVVLGSAVVYSIIMVVQGRLRTVMKLAFCLVLCGIGGFLYADLYGGKSTRDRFATLVADDPLKVYEKSYRLAMVVSAFDTTLVEHPLGAGLGRWGMMRKYFGNEENTESPEIWAEVQFAAWVLDGGFVLLGLYLIALSVAIGRLVKSSFSRRHSGHFRDWGAVLVMLSAGPVAFLFSYCPFYAQMGMQFWLLIGAFEGLAQSPERGTVTRYWVETRMVPGPDSVAEHDSAVDPTSTESGIRRRGDSLEWDESARA